MNLENLISKYLDGELSVEEDQQLRNIISNDFEAKATFEEYVEMSYLINEDSNKINTPSELKDNVEDKILMRIMSDANHYTSNSEISENKEENKRRLIPIAFLFLIGLSIFGYFQFETKKQTNDPNYKLVELDIFQPANNLLAEYETTTTGNKHSKSDKNNNQLSSKSKNTKLSLINNNIDIKNNTSNVNNNQNELKVIANNILDEVSKNTKPKKSFNKILDNETSNITVRNHSETNITSVSISSPLQNIDSDYGSLDFYEEKNTRNFTNQFFGRLEFSSMAGSEMLQGGYSPTSTDPMNNFAQSIAYKINENQKIGFELGFSEYTFSASTRVLIPFSNLDGFVVDPSAGDRYTNSGVSTIVTNDTKYRSFWAGVFAERRLMNIGDLDFNGRVGFGATNSGPLAYGRLLGNYKLFNNISLSAGLDFRMFQSNYSSFLDQSNGFKSNVGFIYGLNITF
ncbi:hypothetical protein OAQ99_03215 [Candidatus Kapabacteria bacterium]|nr:hypothetical protein [Candidatus Kapabacteria bacterium]